MIVPLSLAFSILHDCWQNKGWYDWTGLWRPFRQADDQFDDVAHRTCLRASAAPFVPERKGNWQDSTLTDRYKFLHNTDWRQLRVVSRNHLECAAAWSDNPQHASRDENYGDNWRSHDDEVNQALEEPKVMPKMPPSAYLIYVHEKRGKLKGNPVELAMQLNTSWRALSQAERADFDRRAKELKDKYDKDYAASRSLDTGYAE